MKSALLLLLLSLSLFVASSRSLHAQDSVDVEFRYMPPAGVTAVSLVGQFNSWNTSSWPMQRINDSTFTRTARLRTGTYQYKFYYSGASPWPNDPLNHRYNPADNNNSILIVSHPTVYHFTPNQRTGLVKTSAPTISAYLYPAVGMSVDTSALALSVDSVTYAGIGSFYNPLDHRFSFIPPHPLANGTHRIVLSAGAVRDTVEITVQAGFVQLKNIGGYTTRKTEWMLYGSVEDTALSTATVVRNGTDSVNVQVAGGSFSAVVGLLEGLNTFRAVVLDSTGTLRTSDPVSLTRFVDHRPRGSISFEVSGSDIVVSAAASTDPDSGHADSLTYAWKGVEGNPEELPVSAGEKTFAVPLPSTPGEYMLELVVTDPSGLSDSTRRLFTVQEDGSFRNSTLATVPEWVRTGRIYELFFKSLTPEGTINAALPFLDYFQSLGVNILWVMPVMENAFPINNSIGPGYNISDFYRVAPEYGTNGDFKLFVEQAHARGMKVILDVTPNHTSFAHPFARHARLYREYSPFWGYYEHSIIPHNDNNLGQSLTADGFNYYSGFSDQLLNYDWTDIDAREYMVEVYRWWMLEMGVDGYRFDVYWGPSRRYGESAMGVPVRKALKHRRPDLLLLAEDAGVGVGTEYIYADANGGVDAAHDWPLYHDALKILYSASLETINQKVTNFGGNVMGFIPGENSAFLRFLENHDEERIAYHYGSYERTIPAAALIFTVPGLPMIYSGQEVGFGIGIPDYDQRRRGVINWQAGGRELLQPLYQRLAHLRGQFRAFSSQKFARLTSGDSRVYAYARPDFSEPGVVVLNLSSTPRSVTISVPSSSLAKPVESGSPLVFSDLLADSSWTVTVGGDAITLALELAAYDARILLLGDSARSVALPQLVSVGRREGNAEGEVAGFVLHANYPNPFNPSTTIRLDNGMRSWYRLEVYDVLGRRVRMLFEGALEAGIHRFVWDGRSNEGIPLGSGMYVLFVRNEHRAAAQKMLLLR